MRCGGLRFAAKSSCEWFSTRQAPGQGPTARARGLPSRKPLAARFRRDSRLLCMISAYKFDDFGLPYSQIEQTQTKLSNGMPYVLTASFLIGRRLYLHKLI